MSRFQKIYVDYRFVSSKDNKQLSEKSLDVALILEKKKGINRSLTETKKHGVKGDKRYEIGRKVYVKRKQTLTLRDGTTKQPKLCAIYVHEQEDGTIVV